MNGLVIKQETASGNKATTYQIGHYVEACVANYLSEQGVVILHKNFRCRLGEIDLIVQDREILAFVEVRYRKYDFFGDAKSSVTIHKQRKLKRSAQFFLIRYPSFKNAFCRFDVVSVDTVDDRAQVDWIKGAFE